jgi:hypothetical protein
MMRVHRRCHRLIKQDGDFEGQHSYEELAVPTESNSDLAAALKRQAAWLCDVFQQKLRRQHDYFTALLSDAGKTAEANEHKKLSELRTAFVEQSTENAALVHDCDALKARAHTLQRELEAARSQLFESDAALQRRVSELNAIRSSSSYADAPCQTELSMADIVELMEHARETSRCASAHDIATSTVVEHLPPSHHAELVPLSLPQRADNVVVPTEPAREAVEATDAGTRPDNTGSHAPLQLDYHEIGIVVPPDDDVDWLLDAENAATETPPVPTDHALTLAVVHPTPHPVPSDKTTTVMPCPQPPASSHAAKSPNSSTRDAHVSSSLRGSSLRSPTSPKQDDTSPRRPPFMPELPAGGKPHLSTAASPRRVSALMAPTASAASRESANRVEEAVARMKRSTAAAARGGSQKNAIAASLVASVTAPPTGLVGLIAVAGFGEDAKSLTALGGWLSEGASVGTPLTTVFFDGHVCVMACGSASKALDLAVHQLVGPGAKLALAFDVLQLDSSYVFGAFSCYEAMVARGMMNLLSFGARGEMVVPATVFKSHVAPIHDVLTVLRVEVAFHAGVGEADIFTLHREDVPPLERPVDFYDPMKPLAMLGLGSGESSRGASTTPQQASLVSSRSFRKRQPLGVRCTSWPLISQLSANQVTRSTVGARTPTASRPLMASAPFETQRASFTVEGEVAVDRRSMLVVYSNDRHPDVADMKTAVNAGIQKSVAVADMRCGPDEITSFTHSTQTVAVRKRNMACGPGDSELALAPLPDRHRHRHDSDDEGEGATPAIDAAVPLVMLLRQRLVDLFTCRACNELFTDATILVPCGHIFCRGCVQDRMRILPQDEYDDVVEYRCRQCRHVSFDAPVGCAQLDGALLELRRRGALIM